jgi:hypothetical protein
MTPPKVVIEGLDPKAMRIRIALPVEIGPEQG